jgi:hypothetical protein
VWRLLLEYSFEDGDSSFLRNVGTYLSTTRCHVKADGDLDICMLCVKRIAYDVESYPRWEYQDFVIEISNIMLEEGL